MNPKLKEKFELSLVGYGFLGLHLYAAHIGNAPFSLGFALVAVVFFIRALLIRPTKDDK